MSRLFVRVQTGFYTHRKTARLRTLIGSDAFWVPPRLWAYCAENQPDGDLSLYDSEQLSMLLGYPGNAQALLQALKDSGFIDTSGKVHDWDHYNGYHQAFAIRARAAAVARWSKKKVTKKKEERTKDKGDKHCSSNAQACLDIYNAYPKRVDRPEALRAIDKSLKSISYDDLLAKTKAYAEARKGEDPQWTPYPATWFNGQRFNDDPSTWKNGQGSKSQGHTEAGTLRSPDGTLFKIGASHP